MVNSNLKTLTKLKYGPILLDIISYRSKATLCYVGLGEQGTDSLLSDKHSCQ